MPLISCSNKNESLPKLTLRSLQLIYSAIFSSKNNSYNLFDINQIYKNEESISKLDIDILTYSFPCQDLSVQGLQKGMQIDSHTRSSLVWKIADFLNILYKYEKLPKVLLLENVKNITSVRNKKELDKWLQFLNSLGYFNHCIILNAKDFGSAQSRERFFCISSLKKMGGFRFCGNNLLMATKKLSFFY